MICRMNYRGQLKAGCGETEIVKVLESAEAPLNQLIAEQKLLTFSVFKWQHHIFLHYETTDTPCEETEPDRLVPGLETYLESFPGGVAPRYYVPMYDIFHYSHPLSLAHWQRKTAFQPLGQIVRLKPEMLSSYIFYHYQLQEEKPGCGDKYGMISIHENLLFFYLEMPGVTETAAIPGKLATQNTPENWQELMHRHFIKWEDGDYWKKIHTLFTVSAHTESTKI